MLPSKTSIVIGVEFSEEHVLTEEIISLEFLLLGEGIEVLYVVILLAIRSNSESKKAFYAPGAERKKKKHA